MLKCSDDDGDFVYLYILNYFIFMFMFTDDEHITVMTDDCGFSRKSCGLAR